MAEILEEAIFKGYDKKPTEIDYDTPDFEMMSSLRSDVWQFSGAKNYQEMKAMSEALEGPDGKLRSFLEFKRVVKSIIGDHMQWLKTEYQTAISSSQMAAQWMRIQRDKDILPLLEFDAVMDNRTTELCKSLNRVIRPVDDPFWDAYYPPNHFNCRSGVRQIRDGEITKDENIDYPDLPKMFLTNVGKTGLAFPSGSAYYIGLPREVRRDAASIQLKRVRKGVRLWSNESINSSTGLNVSVGREELGVLNLRRSDVKHATGKSNEQGAIIYDQIRHINKLLLSPNTVFLGTSIDDGGHPEVSAWYYYEIKVGNNLNYINIKKMAGSGQFRFHSIADAKGFDIERIGELTDDGRRRLKK